MHQGSSTVVVFEGGEKSSKNFLSVDIKKFDFEILFSTEITVSGPHYKNRKFKILLCRQYNQYLCCP